MLGISRAPEINRPDLIWYNTPSPVSLADLRSRIVILDFWTSCCINCIQVFPTLRRIEQLFPDKVAVIGVHSPKFDAERLPETLSHAIARYGSGKADFKDGPSDSAGFNAPQGLTCDARTIWVADTGNHALRRIDRTTGSVATLAGLGLRGVTLRQTQPGRMLALASPWDLERAGDALYFANAGTHQIALLDLAGDAIRPLAGTGGENIVDGPAEYALLAQPSGLAMTADGQGLYFADSETSAIRLLTLGANPWVHSIIGHGLFEFGHRNGPFGQALLQHPMGVTTCQDALLISDSYNGVLRRLDLARNRVEDIDLGECEDSLCRSLNEPAGLAVARGNRLLVSDTNNHRIVEVDLRTRRHRTWAH